MGWLRDGTYVVTWKGLALDDDLVPLLCWSIETGEEKMQVGSQGLHHDHFARFSTDNICHCFAGLLIDINPWYRILIRKRLEVSVDSLLAPGIQILFDV